MMGAFERDAAIAQLGGFEVWLSRI